MPASNPQSVQHVVDMPPLAGNECAFLRPDAMASKMLAPHLGLHKRRDPELEALLELLENLAARLQRACAVEVAHVQLDGHTLQGLEEARALDAPDHAELLGERSGGVVDPTLPSRAAAW